jgi:hypothetical protein
MRASSSSIRARRRLLRSQCSQANPSCRPKQVRAPRR